MALKFKTGRIFRQKLLNLFLARKKRQNNKAPLLQQNCARSLRGGNINEIKTLQAPRKPLHIPKKCRVWCHKMNMNVMSAKSINQTSTTVYQWLGAPLPETKHPMFNLGSVQAATAISFSSLQRKKVSSSLRLLRFLPSSSWSKLQGKKTFRTSFFLVLLDVFILGSFTRVNNTSCELAEQAGKVVPLLSSFPFPWVRQAYHSWLWLRPSVLPTLFSMTQHLLWLFCWHHPFTRKKNLLLNIPRGCDFPWTWWLQGFSLNIYMCFCWILPTRVDWILIEISYQTELS